MNLESTRSQFMELKQENGPVLFWLLNDDITEEGMRSQMAGFRDRRIHGLVLHPRIGMTANLLYLSKPFMDKMVFAVEEAARYGMEIILYDEACYPSGSGHGLVVEGRPDLRARGLRLQVAGVDEASEALKEIQAQPQFIRCVKIQKARLNETGALIEESVRKITAEQISYQSSEWEQDAHILIFYEAYTGGVIRGLHPGEDDFEENAPLYSDILNPESTQIYIDRVYEAWYAPLKEHFGRTICAMFTDEPHFGGKNTPKSFRAWTLDFETYLVERGFFMEKLALLWLDSAEGNHKAVREQFEDIVDQRIRECYFVPLANWCSAHGIALTGHPMKADDIGTLSCFQMPCQDIVWRWVEPNNENGLLGPESTQGKCTSDSARHRERKINANECLGAFGWNLRVDEIKWVLDWLFVRGVNLPIMSSAYYSLRAERSLERPPDITQNNLWWHRFGMLSDYVTRLCGFLRETQNTANVAVLCDKNRVSSTIAKELFTRQIEFNYLEAELFDACKVREGALCIANQRYDTLIVPRNGKFTVPIAWENAGIAIFREGEFDYDTLERTVRLNREFAGLRVSRLVYQGKVCYLLVNEGEEDFDGQIYLKEACSCEVWDGWRGTYQTVGTDSSGALRLCLNRRESLIMVPDSSLSVMSKGETQRTVLQLLNEGWKVCSMRPKGAQSIPCPGLWNEVPGMRSFSGNFMYERMIDLNPVEADERLLLNLGEVFDWVEIYLDYRLVDTIFWHPYQADLTQFADGKKHLLCVNVYNSMANHYEDANLPSGLKGPITLEVEKQISSNSSSVSKPISSYEAL